MAKLGYAQNSKFCTLTVCRFDSGKGHNRPGGFPDNLKQRVMEYNGIELDIEQIVSENESLRSQIIEANRNVFAARESAQRERKEREIRESELRKKEVVINRKLADAEKKMADAGRLQHNILSDAGKIRMAAYNDAAKWNNAIAAKFDAMIKDASKTFFGRIIEKPIWERMKRRWMSKRLAKQY